MSKINLFASNRNMSTAVSAYVYNMVQKKGLSMQYADLIKQQENVLVSWENLEGSTMAKTDAEKLAQIKVIESLKAERDEKCKQFAYKATDADKALKKFASVPRTVAELHTALMDWFKQFELECTDTTFMNEIVASAGEKMDWKKFYNTNGTEILRYDNARLLKNAYLKTYEKLVACGLVKAVDVPSPMKKFYDTKKAEADAKKAKKSENK